MKAIDRGTVRDLGGLFVNGGFMITANPCVDEGAEELCEEVVQVAASISHDGVIVVERMQQRGEALIDRPHVHWIISKERDVVERIADQLRAKGLNVKITPVWGVDGLCRYLGKDPSAKCYMMKEEYHTSGGTPPSAHKERREGVPVHEKKEEPTRTIQRDNALPVEGEAVQWASPVVFLLRLSTMPLSRPVRVGMCRAP